MDDQDSVADVADRTIITGDADGVVGTLGSQSRRPVLERQSGCNPRLLCCGVTSGTPGYVRKSNGASSMPGQVRSGVRSDKTRASHTYSPTLSVNSSSGRRMLPATPKLSTYESVRFNGISERDSGRSELRSQLVGAELHEETGRTDDLGVRTSCTSGVWSPSHIVEWTSSEEVTLIGSFEISNWHLLVSIVKLHRHRRRETVNSCRVWRNIEPREESQRTTVM